MNTKYISVIGVLVIILFCCGYVIYVWKPNTIRFPSRINSKSTNVVAIKNGDHNRKNTSRTETNLVIMQSRNKSSKLPISPSSKTILTDKLSVVQPLITTLSKNSITKPTPRTTPLLSTKQTTIQQQTIFITKSPISYKSIKPNHCVVVGMRTECISSNHQNLIGVHQCKNLKCACYPNEITLIAPLPISDPTFPPDKDMLPIERDTLHDKEFVDILTTANSKLSVMVLENPKRTHKVGDLIKIRIDLIDGHGKSRLIGGDEVRVWMKSPNEIYKASGDVSDLKNGSYLATLKALWEGEAVVYAALPYTREVISAMLRWRRQYRTLFYYYGVFTKDKVNEYVMCSPYSTHMGYRSVCNLTTMNYGNPFFCGRPLNPSLNCDDFVFFNDFDFTEIPFTAAQFTTFNRFNTKIMLSSTLKLTVAAGPQQQSNINCNQLPHRDTWNITMPTGYFDKKQWKYLKCQNSLNKSSIINCLRNTTLIIYGDSTSRQWYVMLESITQCVKITEKWSKKHWYKYTECVRNDLNFSLIKAPHNFPFPNGFKTSNGMINVKSVAASLHELPSDGKIIFVFHYYCHFVRQHYTLFINQIRSIKTAMRNALKRNKDLQIAIKAPHVFYDELCPSHLNDYQGKLFIDILQKELEEFKDYVWYLNFWDMNTACENGPIHPADDIVWENLKLLFGFTCK